MQLKGSQIRVAIDQAAPPPAELLAGLACAAADAPLLFGVYAGKLGLRLNDGGKTSPLTLDFTAGPLAERIKQASPKNEMMARACGVTRKISPKLLDASGGLGRDALVLAACGAQVTLIERNPFLAAMLKEAIESASETGDAALETARPEERGARVSNGIVANLTLIEGDARAIPSAELGTFDTIYFDPMFPERSKAAAVKLDMQILQALHGTDEDDAEAVLAHLLTAQAHRTVVKRPVKAPELGATSRPNLRMRSGAMRFDVWLDF